MDVLNTLPIVIDVGGSYDHNKLRYDHHQRTFNETLNEKYQTRLSACGLVYKHYGLQIIAELHPQLQDDDKKDKLLYVYDKMYKVFMEGLDAIDNGIEVADKVRYREGTGLSQRVKLLNQRWNEKGGASEDERFEKASEMCGDDFSAQLAFIVNCEMEARDYVESAILKRFEVDKGGEIICFIDGGMTWKSHLYDLEKKHGIDGKIKFVLYTDSSGMWRVQAVTVEKTLFSNRVSLDESWRGLRDDDLSKKSGIAGCKFCHNSGFIGGHVTFEGALAMALRSVENDNNHYKDGSK